MLIFTTESGTRYEYDQDKNRVRRIPEGQALAMRRDGEWLDLKAGTYVLLGVPVVMQLEPLGAGNVTIRTTSPVVKFEESERGKN